MRCANFQVAFGVGNRVHHAALLVLSVLRKIKRRFAFSELDLKDLVFPFTSTIHDVVLRRVVEGQFDLRVDSRESWVDEEVDLMDFMSQFYGMNN